MNEIHSSSKYHVPFPIRVTRIRSNLLYIELKSQLHHLVFCLFLNNSKEIESRQCFSHEHFRMVSLKVRYKNTHSHVYSLTFMNNSVKTTNKPVIYWIQKLGRIDNHEYAFAEDIPVRWYAPSQ